MPNIKSAKKRLVVTDRQTKENAVIRTKVKNAVKKFNTLLSEGKIEEAKKFLPEAMSTIDKAACIYHKNALARKKAHLSKNLYAYEHDAVVPAAGTEEIKEEKAE